MNHYSHILAKKKMEKNSVWLAYITINTRKLYT